MAASLTSPAVIRVKVNTPYFQAKNSIDADISIEIIKTNENRL